MIIVVWVVLGLMAGLWASKLSHHTGSALALDVALAVGGAIAGGLAMRSLGFSQSAPFLIASLLGAAAGSIATIAAYRAIFQAT